MNTKTDPDTKFLEPLGNQKLRIGFVEEIHGQESQIVPDFEPTEAELRIIAKYYAKLELDYSLIWFFDSQTGSDWLRMRSYAIRRIARIQEHIGSEAIAEVDKKVVNEAKKRFSDREWKAFEEGDTETKDQIYS